LIHLASPASPVIQDFQENLGIPVTTVLLVPPAILENLEFPVILENLDLLATLVSQVPAFQVIPGMELPVTLASLVTLGFPVTLVKMHKCPVILASRVIPVLTLRLPDIPVTVALPDIQESMAFPVILDKTLRCPAIQVILVLPVTAVILDILVPAVTVENPVIPALVLQVIQAP
jgi:hypothetical protein